MSSPRFLYHASAVGVGGNFVRPFQEMIPAKAVSALPSSGGYSSDRHEEFRLREVFSFGAAHSEVSGNFNPTNDAHETSATATIEKYNLNNVVAAEVITARLTSSHPASTEDAPLISPQGSFFKGLRIAGRDIELESKIDDFSELDTLTKLRARYKEDPEFRRALDEAAFCGKSDSIPPDRHKYFPWRRHAKTSELPSFQGRTIVPLFIVKNPSAPGFEVLGNVIRVTDFGTIHIGELVIDSHQRRITMLHVDLGSPLEGTITVGCVDGNGGTTDPPSARLTRSEGLPT